MNDQRQIAQYCYRNFNEPTFSPNKARISSKSSSVNMVFRFHCRSIFAQASGSCNGKEAVTFFHFPNPGVIPAPPIFFCQVTAWYTDRISSDGVSASAISVSSPDGKVCIIPYFQSLILCHVSRPRIKSFSLGAFNLPGLMYQIPQVIPGDSNAQQQGRTMAVADLYTKSGFGQIMNQGSELPDSCCLIWRSSVTTAGQG